MPESTTTRAMEADFKRNLIDRFFHAKSYFLNSFLTRLREIEGGSLPALQVVNVGLVMDELANSDDKLSLLAKLDQFPTFSRYHEQLHQGIEFLQKSHLSTQQMMEIVNSLGRSLADAVAELIGNDTSREQLFALIGIKGTEQAPALAGANEQDPAAQAASAGAGIPTLKLEWQSETESTAHEDVPELEMQETPEAESDEFAGVPKLDLDLSAEFEAAAENLEADPERDAVQDNSESEDLNEILKLELEAPLDVTITETELSEAELDLPAAEQAATADIPLSQAPAFPDEEVTVFRGEESPEAGVEDAGVQPWSHFKDDVDEKLKSLNGHLDAFAQDPHNWRCFRRIKKDFRDLRDWAMIQGDEGIEALSHKVLLLIETVYLRGSEKRTVIFAVLRNTYETLFELNEAGRGSEHLDIVRIMANQIDKQRRLYPRSLHPAHGQAEVTPAAVTATPPQQGPAESVSPDITSAAAVESADTLQVPEPAEAAPEQEAAAAVPDESTLEIEEIYRFQEEDAGGQTAAADQSGQEDFGSIRESELLSELIDEQVESGIGPEESDILAEPEVDGMDRAAAEAASGPGSEEVESHAEADSSDTKQPAKDHKQAWEIPGEADQDLLGILGDIKEEVDLVNTAVMKSDTVPDIKEDPEVAETPAFETKNEAAPTRTPPAESAPERPSESKQQEPGQPQENGTGLDYVTEADMYFTFSRKALQELMRNPAKGQSMEDSELAFYSLKVLAERLGYPLVRGIMTCAERLIQQKLGSNAALSTVQVNSLYSVVTEIEQACRDKKLNEPSRQAWLKQQLTVLKKWAGSHAAGAMKIESLTSAKAERMKAEDDPMDFLLFDDTSNFFKQLLKE